MKKFLNNSKSLIYCICEAIIGILILVNPISFTSAIVRIVGIVLAVMGVLDVIGYFRLSPEEGSMSQCLAKGLIFLAAGVFCVFRPEWFSNTFPVLAVIYGIGILVIGLIKVQWTVDILRNHLKFWFVPAIGALSSILLAVIILSNPFATVEVMWIFVGISLIFEAIVDGVSVFFECKRPDGYEVEIE